jgi:hypothetical protein
MKLSIPTIPLIKIIFIFGIISNLSAGFEVSSCLESCSPDIADNDYLSCSKNCILKLTATLEVPSYLSNYGLNE